MPKIHDIYSTINAAFPFSEAENWDNSGLLVENDKEISKILIALDATSEVVLEAIQKGADLIITHHPVIFNPIKNLCLNNPSVMALKNDIGIISVHTNYDVGYLSADSMFSELLAECMQFREEGILDITQTEPQPHGFGRYGRLSKPLSASEFAEILKEALKCDCLRYTDGGRLIRKVAFCCGGGSEYISKATDEGFDAYITSDVKHSAFIEANNNGISLFAPTHYQMEKPAMKSMADFIKNHFADCEVFESEMEKEPSLVI